MADQVPGLTLVDLTCRADGMAVVDVDHYTLSNDIYFGGVGHHSVPGVERFHEEYAAIWDKWIGLQYFDIIKAHVLVEMVEIAALV